MTSPAAGMLAAVAAGKALAGTVSSAVAAADTALHTAEGIQRQLHFAPAPAQAEDTRGTHPSRAQQQAGSAVRHMHSGLLAEEEESAGVRMAETV